MVSHRAESYTPLCGRLKNLTRKSDALTQRVNVPLCDVLGAAKGFPCGYLMAQVYTLNAKP